MYTGSNLVEANNGRFYIHSDHLGSNSAMSYGNGHPQEGQLVPDSLTRYTPFGDYRTGKQGEITDRGYTGHRENDYIKLVDMNARWYAPTIGRFISPDTIVPNPTNPQTLNRYSYVNNNPIRYTDPTGHYAANSSNGGGYSCADSDDCGAKANDPRTSMNDKTCGTNCMVRVDNRGVAKEHFFEPYTPPTAAEIAGNLAPDAHILGGSLNGAGLFAGVVGGEVLTNFDTGQVSAFSYVGWGGGAVVKANATGYTGFVWNIEDNKEYEGVFVTLTADLSFIEGGQVNFFWDPTTIIPFVGRAWGFTVGHSNGFGAGVSGTVTDFTCQLGC